MQRTVVGVILCMLLFTCSQQPEKAQETVPSEKYIAKVGSEVITPQDIEDRLSRIPDYAREMYEGEEGLKNIVDELIKTELLYLKAKDVGLDKNPEYIKNVNDYKKFTLVSLLFEMEIASRAEVTEKEARIYYNKNKSNFTRSQEVKASHILVKSKTEAEDILKELRKGTSFASLAREKSIDKKSAEDGGNLGFFTKGQMVPEFEAVAFSLKKGHLSKPVKSKYGYHVIKVTDIRGGEIVDFMKVKELIIQRLEEEKQQEIFDTYIEKIKSAYSVTMNDDMLEDFISSHK